MAIKVYRSCNADLHTGMIDGGWKQYAMNRGGYVEGVSAGIRRCMSGVWHGMNEAQTKYLPDGRPCNTPYYVAVSPADVENV